VGTEKVADSDVYRPQWLPNGQVMAKKAAKPPSRRTPCQRFVQGHLFLYLQIIEICDDFAMVEDRGNRQGG
jgi:hypothetical protein